MAEDLGEYRRTVNELRSYEELSLKALRDLEALESLTVTADKLHAFRGKLVDLARGTGCQIRQLRTGESRSRAWKPGDDPLDDIPRTATEPGGFMLESHELSFAVAGSQASVKEFLSRLYEQGVLLHTRHLSLQPADSEEKHVVLELNVRLFGLDHRKEAA